jgi:signal transduction histidine kinase
VRRPDGLVQAGLAAGFMVLLVADVIRVAAERGWWPVSLGAGLAVCGLALLRGRDLTWTAVTGLGVWGLAAGVSARWSLPAQPVAAVAGLAVLGGAAVRALPAGRAVAIALAGAGVVAAGRAADSPGAAEAQALIGVLVWTAAVAVGLWLRYQDAQRQAAAAAVRREVRLDLARELHDVVAHHITGLVIQTQAARLAAGPGNPAANGSGQARAGQIGDALAGIETAGAAALAALRRVVGLLRDHDDTSSVRPGPEELAGLAARFAGHGPPVELRLPSGPPDPSWPPELSTTVYRVVQESLTNAVRHAAGATLVVVTVGHDRHQVTVEVTDDAPVTGSPSARTGGYGLLGMRERVEALGGTLQAGPTETISQASTIGVPHPGAPGSGIPSLGDPARPPGPARPAGPANTIGPAGPANPAGPAGPANAVGPARLVHPAKNPDPSRPGQARPGRGGGWTVRATLPVVTQPEARPAVTRRGGL